MIKTTYKYLIDMTTVMKEEYVQEICNICGQELMTHKYEELDVCDECQILIDKELAKPTVKQS